MEWPTLAQLRMLHLSGNVEGEGALSKRIPYRGEVSLRRQVRPPCLRREGGLPSLNKRWINVEQRPLPEPGPHPELRLEGAPWC